MNTIKKYLAIVSLFAVMIGLQHNSLTGAAGTWKVGKASTIYAEQVQELIEKGSTSVFEPIPYGSPTVIRVVASMLFFIFTPFPVGFFYLLYYLLGAANLNLQRTIKFRVGLPALGLSIMLCYFGMLFLTDSSKIIFYKNGIDIHKNCKNKGLFEAFIRFFIPTWIGASDFIPYSQILHVDFIIEANLNSEIVQYNYVKYNGKETSDRTVYTRKLAIICKDGRKYLLSESYFQRYGTFERLIGILQLHGISVWERRGFIVIKPSDNKQGFVANT